MNTRGYYFMSVLSFLAIVTISCRQRADTSLGDNRIVSPEILQTAEGPLGKLSLDQYKEIIKKAGKKHE